MATVSSALPSRELKYFLFGASFTVLLFIVFTFFIKSALIPFASAQSASIQACATAMAETGRLMASGTPMQQALQGQTTACAGLSSAEMTQAAQLNMQSSTSTMQNSTPTPTQPQTSMVMTTWNNLGLMSSIPSSTAQSLIDAAKIACANTKPEQVTSWTQAGIPNCPASIPIPVPVLITPTLITPQPQITPTPLDTSIDTTVVDPAQAQKLKDLEKLLNDLTTKQLKTQTPGKPNALQNPTNKPSAPESPADGKSKPLNINAPVVTDKLPKSPLQKALDIVGNRIDGLTDLADAADSKDGKKKFDKESTAVFGLITNLCRNAKFAVSDKCNVKKWQRSFKKNAKDPDAILDLLDEMNSALND